MKGKFILGTLMGVTATIGLAGSLHMAAKGIISVEERLINQISPYKAKFDALYLRLTEEPQPKRPEYSEPDLKTIAKESAQRVGLTWELAETLIEIESNWKNNAINFEPSLQADNSPQEAMNAASHGLTQVIGKYWKGTHGCEAVKTFADLYDPRKNTQCGFTIIRDGLKKYNSLRLTLIAYNGGSSCTSKKCPQAELYADRIMARVANKILSADKLTTS